MGFDWSYDQIHAGLRVGKIGRRDVLLIVVQESERRFRVLNAASWELDEETKTAHELAEYFKYGNYEKVVV